MGKLNNYEISQLDDFANKLNIQVKSLEHFSEFLQLEPKDKRCIKEGLNILNSKLKIIKKADGAKDLKQVLKVKKILDQE